MSGETTALTRSAATSTSPGSTSLSSVGEASRLNRSRIAPWTVDGQG